MPEILIIGQILNLSFLKVPNKKHKNRIKDLKNERIIF